MRQMVDTWVNRPAVDYVLVALAAAVALAINPASLPEVTYLGAWYQTLASVCGVLFGFGSVALTIVFAVTPSRRLQAVYDRVGTRLAKLVMSCLGGLVVATVGFVGLYLVPQSSAAVRNALTAALIVLAVGRFARLWWIFHNVLRALMTEDDDANERERPEANWERPTVVEGDYSVPARRAESA